MTIRVSNRLNKKENSCPLCRNTRIDSNRSLQNIEDVIKHFSYIRNKKQEHFICLSIDSGHRPIACRIITIGLLDATLVHPREVFAGPLEDRAASIVIAHNHPSGNIEPSTHDIEVTQQLVAAGQLLGIKVQDHIIITSNNFFSFHARGLI